jgi:hypothetical protein
MRLGTFYLIRYGLIPEPAAQTDAADLAFNDRGDRSERKGGARKGDAEKYARHFSVYGGQGAEKSGKSRALAKSWNAYCAASTGVKQPVTCSP